MPSAVEVLPGSAVDRLGWFATRGATMSGLPIPPVRGIAEHEDHVQWVAEEVRPRVA